MPEINLNEKITEVEREYGIRQISMLVFRIKGNINLENIENFVKRQRIHRRMYEDVFSKEGFTQDIHKEGNVLTTYYGKEGVRTLRFTDENSRIVPCSLRVVPDVAKIQFKKEDGFVDVIVYGGSEKFIERSVHRVLNQIAGTNNCRLYSPSIDQRFIQRLCLYTHRRKVNFIRIDPSKSKNYAKRIEEEFKKEKIKKYHYVVEEGQFKGSGILESKGLKLLFEKESDIEIIEYKSKLNIPHKGKIRETKYQLNANGKVSFFVETDFINNFDNEFDAGKELLKKLEEDAGEQLLLTDDIKIQRDFAQKGLIDFTITKEDQLDLLKGHMRTRDYDALPKILNDLKRYDLTESEKEYIIRAYITLLHEDIISAYEFTDFFTQLFDESVVNNHKKEFERIFRGMDSWTVYKFLRKRIDPLAGIINPIISKKEVQRNELKRLWKQVISEQEDKHKKGKLLEEFSKLFFSFEGGLIVDSVNFRTENEEIDLILKHKIDDPFWSQINSPFIFVECKNWSSKVGSDEVKLFKSKVTDHGNLTRIGILISVNGFTEGIDTEQIRVVKEDKILCAIEGKDIETFLNSKMSLTEFLEELIKRSIK